MAITHELFLVITKPPVSGQINRFLTKRIYELYGTFLRFCLVTNANDSENYWRAILSCHDRINWTFGGNDMSDFVRNFTVLSHETTEQDCFISFIAPPFFPPPDERGELTGPAIRALKVSNLHLCEHHDE